MYYVYILRSKRDKRFYLGCTNNIARRLEEHNKKLSVFDKLHAPFELIYFEAYKSKQDAFTREQKLKQFKQGFYRVLERLRKSLCD